MRRDIVASSFFGFATFLLILAMAGPVLTLLASVAPSDAIAAFANPSAQDALRVSLTASLLATFIAALLGVPAGYWIAGARPALRAATLFFLALPLAFPPVASGVMILHIVGIRAPLGAWLASHGIPGVDSLTGVVVAEFFVAGSFVAITAAAAFAALPPIYEEAARTLGVSEWKIFARIALPAAFGNIAAGITFAWLRAIGEYGATSIVAYHPTTLPIALYVTLSAAGVRPALALAYGFIVLAAVVLGVQWVLRRRVV